MPVYPVTDIQHRSYSYRLDNIEHVCRNDAVVKGRRVSSAACASPPQSADRHGPQRNSAQVDYDQPCPLTKLRSPYLAVEHHPTSARSSVPLFLHTCGLPPDVFTLPSLPMLHRHAYIWSAHA